MTSWSEIKDKKPYKNQVVIIITPKWGQYILATYDDYRNAFVNIYDSNRLYDDERIPWCPIPKYDLNE